MRHARRRVVRRVTRLAAVGGLLLGGAMVTTRRGERAPRPIRRRPATPRVPATGTGTDLVSRLGTSRTAGSWVDAAGRPVVAVTDEKAATEVERAGAQAKMVRHSMSDLKSATSTLRSAPRVSGTSWALDYQTQRDRGTGRQHRLRLRLVPADRGRGAHRRLRADGAHRGYVHDADQRRGADPVDRRALFGGLQRDRRDDRLHPHGRALRARRFHLVLPTTVAGTRSARRSRGAFPATTSPW